MNSQRGNVWTRTTGAFVVALSLGSGSSYAQTDAATHETPDPSELAPAPSTLKGAIADSFRLLAIEHTARVAFQQKTRRELGGPFFPDYLRSVKIPHGWNDGEVKRHLADAAAKLGLSLEKMFALLIALAAVQELLERGVL